MMRHARDLPILRLSLLAAAVALAGCASGMAPTRFAHPRFDFGFVERVAVVPFENLSNDRAAGARVTRLVITELLASGAVDVVEPGEVQAALDRLGARITAPSTEQVVSLGRTLGVQAVVVGTVTQSEVLRSGAVDMPVVGLDAHMLESETGAAVWAATHTERASGLGPRLLGTGGEPVAETTRRCVRRLLATLLES
ncbi:MAG: penicillin-binding protein activator LpoB [Thermoanaerobaculia bacterium]